MNAEMLVAKGRTNLVLNSPFFASILLRLKMIASPDDPRVQTMATDGYNIWFNPQFVENEIRDVGNMIGVLAHEVMHIVLLHHTRRGLRDPARWNMAADFAINLILRDNGFSLPGEPQTLGELLAGGVGYLLDPAFSDMSTERIYEKIPLKGGKNFVSCGDVREPKDCKSLEDAETEGRVLIAQAAHAAKLAGKMPAGLERIVGSSLEEKICWREHLQKFFRRTRISETSWRRPNRRFAHMGMYLPTEVVEPTGVIACCVDTSGSIGGLQLESFSAEMKAIFQFVCPEKLIVMYCDADVGRVDEFTQADDFVIHPVGGGGTDFRPPFKWLKEHDIVPDAFVYLTDGYGSFPKAEMEYPVLWAINNHDVSPPWGEHLVLEI